MELRKAKGMTEEQAYELTVNNEMFYGCLMLKSGDVDGLVGGRDFFKRGRFEKRVSGHQTRSRH